MKPFKEANGLPIEQCNAPYEPAGKFVMRVGIPHRSGKLAFHAFENEYPVMVSANAFWDPNKQAFALPKATDLSECDTAVDSGGFSAMSLWKSNGPQRGMAGIFPWTVSEYIEFATSMGASWWAAPDLCCEPELAGNEEEVDFRVRATATLLEATLQQLYIWHCELAKTCNARTIANMLPPPVPVLQGWDTASYQQSAELLQRVWERWQPWLAAPALIGVGSVADDPSTIRSTGCSTCLQASKASSRADHAFTCSESRGLRFPASSCCHGSARQTQWRMTLEPGRRRFAEASPTALNIGLGR